MKSIGLNVILAQIGYFGLKESHYFLSEITCRENKGG